MDSVTQQECLAHALRNITQAMECKQGRVGRKLKASLQEALQLWRDGRDGKIADLADPARRIQNEVTRQLRNRVLQDDDNQRLLNGLGRQQDRGRLLLFLDRPEVEPTNNRAEPILRPAVIARKVSQCSKTWAGAHDYAAFKSIAQTVRKNGQASLTDTFRQLFQSPQPQPAPP